MREWRKHNPMTDEQRRKDIVRSIAGVQKRAGKLIPQPCEKCGTSEDLQMHHEDYSKPLDVRWLCAECHQDEHHPGRQRAEITLGGSA
jgi:ribosomal protein S27AE